MSGRTAAVNSRQAVLWRVVALEHSPDRIGRSERQELSAALAVLGRQREARAIPLLPAAGGQEPLHTPVARDPDPPLAAIPWRDAVTRIAAEYRRGLIVEAHAVTEDRAWIEQALGTFRAAVFSPDFAEAINESGSTPKSHGYSTSGIASSRSWTTTLTRVMLQHRWVPPDGVCPTVTNGGRRG